MLGGGNISGGKKREIEKGNRLGVSSDFLELFIAGLSLLPALVVMITIISFASCTPSFKAPFSFVVVVLESFRI